MTREFRFKRPRSTPRCFSKRRLVLRNTGTGLLICSSSSLALTFLFHSVSRLSPLDDKVPLLFLLVVGLVSRRYGTASGITGMLAAGCIFSTFLFPPLGSLVINGEGPRTNVFMMLLFGLAVAYFYGNDESSDGPGDLQTK